MTGIKKRWVRNYIAIVVLITFVISISFMFVVRGYVYNSAYQTLQNKAKMWSEFSTRYLKTDSKNLYSTFDKVSKDLLVSDLYEVELYSNDSKMVRTFYGMTYHSTQLTSDVESALKGFDSRWSGSDSKFDDNLISVAIPVYDGDGRVVGAIRYISSTSKLELVLFKYSIITLFIFIFVNILLAILSFAFSISILKPINEIIKGANSFAEGKFPSRINENYNDEFGQLARTLNYMADEIQNTEKMKNEFISSISHEIRTPLTAVNGWAETILSGQLNSKEDIETGLKIIIKETNRLSKMVEELLDFSKLESRRLTLYLEEVYIDDEVKEIYEIFKRKAEQKDIRIIYESDVPKTVHVEVDVDRIRQVIVNVLDNAIKFTENGKDIRISTYCDNNFVYIKIADEGCGIDEDDLNDVTKKFHKGKSRKYGSGLGLSISREIISLHGGMLEINSKRNIGTVVLIKLKINK